MRVNFRTIKINMIINLTRDYFTLKHNASVGVMFLEDEEMLDINCTYGMGGYGYSLEIGDVLEEDDPSVILKLLNAKFKAQDRG
ncbi:hypothetical protein FZD47_23990 [Bacillus infantis]|uniref:Uncharacterized protein n=1 Tax=Bacillus infantis TaxID=324767 RepID=A0A5D4S401_9BACI|nr:hypothetical protein [Bacillus infantis]TYS57900.1 hypothetical protein FZD47_23990 [Bacillus infantis]